MASLREDSCLVKIVKAKIVRGVTIPFVKSYGLVDPALIRNEKGQPEGWPHFVSR